MSLKVNIEKYFKPDVYLDDVVRTSSTSGLLKNDGTVDTTSYATSASVSAITDGQSIDSFSDVETALAGKDDIIGTVENNSTASKAYAIGEHFIRNDKFCTVIAAIASGATLTLNTNYVEGTIAECIARQGTYSTTETKIGTWLGHDLYRKVIDCGGLPNNSTKYVSAGIGSAIKVKHIYGTASANNNVTSNIPLPYLHEYNSYYNVALQYVPNGESSHPDSIFLQTWANQTVFNISEVVIEYIKV